MPATAFAVFLPAAVTNLPGISYVGNKGLPSISTPKIMKTILIALSCAALPAFRYFESDFDRQLQEAGLYCFSIESETDIIADQYGLKAAEILPVVYPECARYSALSDRAEGTVLEYYYIQNGVAGADFSVGRFQMKPSFVEALEAKISSEDYLSAFKERFAYKPVSIKQQREERLNRLLDQSWQTHYLCCFCLIRRHETTGTILTTNEQIADMAAAYNYGFTKPAGEIAHWRTVSAFPNGLSAVSGNYNYADLAIAFHQKMTGYAHN
jgi:hypothetical protein